MFPSLLKFSIWKWISLAIFNSKKKEEENHFVQTFKNLLKGDFLMRISFWKANLNSQCELHFQPLNGENFLIFLLSKFSPLKNRIIFAKIFLAFLIYFSRGMMIGKNWIHYTFHYILFIMNPFQNIFLLH